MHYRNFQRRIWSGLLEKKQQWTMVFNVCKTAVGDLPVGREGGAFLSHMVTNFCSVFCDLDALVASVE